MKKLLPILLCCALLCGCGTEASQETTAPTGTQDTVPHPEVTGTATEEIPYISRCDGETVIVLSDQGITVDGGQETDAVFTSNDIIYYEDKDAYESGNPYGEGTDTDKHTADEAAAHTVVNITEPGAYRVTGKLSAGQIRIDLGEDAYDDPDAVVELILEDADITCTVAPAILFLNVYECDGEWSTDTATASVDTSNAGANLILEGENTVSGSYVAKIFKDKEGEKKLWKQDGAIYSYMSLNVYGPGKLDLTAANEGLDTELHLTVNGGSIAIRSGNDGINTNEDGVSVTTINAGTLHIIAGLGDEGDGVDSNGYLVINGGTVVSSANPGADAGLDSDLGSYVNGGTVIALGSTMDWAESDSEQVTMNLQFAQNQSSGSSIVIAAQDGTVVFAYDPAMDEVLGENQRQYMGAVISCPNFYVGQSYTVHIGGSVSGTETGGVYDVTTVTSFDGGTQMMYTGSDLRMGFGGGQRPGDRTQGDWDADAAQGRPDGDFTWPDGELPEGEMQKGEMQKGELPEGEMPSLPEGETMPQGGKPDGMASGGERPDGQMQGGQRPDGEVPGTGAGDAEISNTLFYMQDKVNAFTGVTAAQ